MQSLEFLHPDVKTGRTGQFRVSRMRETAAGRSSRLADQTDQDPAGGAAALTCSAICGPGLLLVFQHTAGEKREKIPGRIVKNMSLLFTLFCGVVTCKLTEYLNLPLARCAPLV